MKFTSNHLKKKLAAHYQHVGLLAVGLDGANDATVCHLCARHHEPLFKTVYEKLFPSNDWPGIDDVHNLFFAEETLHKRLDKYINTADSGRVNSSGPLYFDTDGRYVWVGGDGVFPPEASGKARWMDNTGGQLDLPRKLLTAECLRFLRLFNHVVVDKKR